MPKDTVGPADEASNKGAEPVQRRVKKRAAWKPGFAHIFDLCVQNPFIEGERRNRLAKFASYMERTECKLGDFEIAMKVLTMEDIQKYFIPIVWSTPEIGRLFKQRYEDLKQKKTEVWDYQQLTLPKKYPFVHSGDSD